MELFLQIQITLACFTLLLASIRINQLMRRVSAIEKKTGEEDGKNHQR